MIKRNVAVHTDCLCVLHVQNDAMQLITNHTQ